MDLAEYFNQEEMYFSESSGQMTRLEDMPFQRAFYSHYKLLREFNGEYAETRLYRAFTRILDPRPAEIRSQLSKYGKASARYIDSDSKIRSKILSAAKVAGKTVSTHKHEVSSGLGWIEASVDTEANIRVKSH